MPENHILVSRLTGKSLIALGTIAILCAGASLAMPPAQSPAAGTWRMTKTEKSAKMRVLDSLQEMQNHPTPHTSETCQRTSGNELLASPGRGCHFVRRSISPVINVVKTCQQSGGTREHVYSGRASAHRFDVTERVTVRDGSGTILASVETQEIGEWVGPTCPEQG